MKKSKSIHQSIFKIAIPNILGNITIPLIGLVDTILMGYNKENAPLMIGAIGLGGILFNALYWNFGFLRVSTTGLTAQAFGAENKRLQALTLFRSLLLGAVLAVVLFSLQAPFSSFGFSLLKSSENADVLPLANQYFSVRILALPAVFLLFGLRGWFYGVQNAVIPLILTFVINIVNILASVYFVQELNMGVKGVALGSVLSQYIGLLVAVLFILIKYRWIFKHFILSLLVQVDEISRFFFVSGFVFARNILLFSVFSSFTYFSSLINSSYLAVNQILLQLFYLMSFAVDGFAYAAEALVGKEVGAKNNLNVKKVIQWTMLYGLGFGLLYALVYLFAGDFILSLLTSDESLIKLANDYMIWLSLLSIFGAVAFIWDGIYIGATLVVQMFISMFFATVAFYFVFFKLKSVYPTHAIWAAMSTYMLFRGLFQWVLYLFSSRKYK